MTFLVDSTIINSNGNFQLSAIAITTLASVSNFGKNHAPHLALIGMFGFESCCIAGLILSCLTLMASNKIYEWIARGEGEDDKSRLE